MSHEFFANVDWKDVYDRKVPGPWIPHVTPISKRASRRETRADKKEKRNSANRKDCVAASQPADTGNDKANSNNKGTNGNNNESADDEVVTGGQNYSSSAIKIDGHHNEPSKISASPNLHSEFGISPENGELNAGHFRQVSMETARPIDASGVARQEHGEPNGSQVDEGLFTVREGTSHGARVRHPRRILQSRRHLKMKMIWRSQRARRRVTTSQSPALRLPLVVAPVNVARARVLGTLSVCAIAS